MKGVGSGDNQGIGPSHHSYKDGIGTYRQFTGTSCEQCGSAKFLCAHHRDEDRTNNVKENIQTLCKRCHQLLHNCAAALPKIMTEEHRKKLSDNMKRLNATLPRVNGKNTK